MRLRRASECARRGWRCRRLQFLARSGRRAATDAPPRRDQTPLWACRRSRLTPRPDQGCSPPPRRISSKPAAPSRPIPVSTTPHRPGSDALRHRHEQDVDRRPMAVHEIAMPDPATPVARAGPAPQGGPRRQAPGRRRPRRGGAPSCASFTTAAQAPLRRAAKPGVKAAGMCWVTRVGGQFSGKAARTRVRASTPAGGGADRDDTPVRREVRHRMGGGRAPRSSPRAAPAAAITLAASSENAAGSPLDGLATQSTGADLQGAARVASAPARVRLETMITGIGRSRMTLSRKSSPFMLGISISSVITSGIERLDRRARLHRITGLAPPPPHRHGGRAQARSDLAWWRCRPPPGRGTGFTAPPPRAGRSSGRRPPDRPARPTPARNVRCRAGRPTRGAS